MNTINKSKNIFTVIDVGNSRTSCLIGTSVKTNNVQIRTLGFGCKTASHVTRAFYVSLALIIFLLFKNCKACAN